jgi:hypothetical protein
MKAFPKTSRYDENNGMDLRDYFAAKAMQAYLTTTRRKNIDEGYVVSDDQYAAWAYEMADAMMEMRGNV